MSTLKGQESNAVISLIYRRCNQRVTAEIIQPGMNKMQIDNQAPDFDDLKIL